MDFNKINLRYKKVSYLKKPDDLTLEDAFDVFNEIILQGKTINDNFRCYPDALSFIMAPARFSE